jgi:hypothetical protein
MSRLFRLFTRFRLSVGSRPPDYIRWDDGESWSDDELFKSRD